MPGAGSPRLAQPSHSRPRSQSGEAPCPIPVTGRNTEAGHPPESQSNIACRASPGQQARRDEVVTCRPPRLRCSTHDHNIEGNLPQWIFPKQPKPWHTPVRAVGANAVGRTACTSAAARPALAVAVPVSSTTTCTLCAWAVPTPCPTAKCSAPAATRLRRHTGGVSSHRAGHR